MECVKTKEELFALTPDEIYNRLVDFYNEGGSGDNEEEIICAGRYLSRALHFLANKYLRNKVKDDSPESPCFFLAQAAAFAYDCLAPISYKHAYQKALLIWLNNSDLIQGRRIPLPKELEDKPITPSLAKVIGGRSEDTLDDVPELLEHAIQQAKGSNDELMACKATALLDFIRTALMTYAKEQTSISVQQKFIVRMGEIVKAFPLGRVVVKATSVELHTNDPAFPFNPQAIPFGTGEALDKLNTLLEIYTKMTADRLCINNEKMELRHAMSSVSDSCIIITFSLIDKN